MGWRGEHEHQPHLSRGSEENYSLRGKQKALQSLHQKGLSEHFQRDVNKTKAQRKSVREEMIEDRESINETISIFNSAKYTLNSKRTEADFVEGHIKVCG